MISITSDLFFNPNTIQFETIGVNTKAGRHQKFIKNILVPQVHMSPNKHMGNRYVKILRSTEVKRQLAM